MWCNGRSPTCPDDSPPRTENTCSRDTFRHRSQQQMQYLESVIMRSLTCYRCLMSPLAAGTVRSFGSLYCGRTLAFNWPSHSTSFSIMTPNAAIFDNGLQILMTMKMTAEMSKVVPGGHEGRHVQLQRKGHVGGDLPPELRWMLKPLDSRKHRNERCRRAAEFTETHLRRENEGQARPTDRPQTFWFNQLTDSTKTETLWFGVFEQYSTFCRFLGRMQSCKVRMDQY